MRSTSGGCVGLGVLRSPSATLDDARYRCDRHQNATDEREPEPDADRCLDTLRCTFDHIGDVLHVDDGDDHDERCDHRPDDRRTQCELAERAYDTEDDRWDREDESENAVAALVVTGHVASGHA